MEAAYVELPGKDTLLLSAKNRDRHCCFYVRRNFPLDGGGGVRLRLLTQTLVVPFRPVIVILDDTLVRAIAVVLTQIRCRSLTPL